MFQKDKITWNRSEVIAPDMRVDGPQEKTKLAAINELTRKDSEINFCRGDILHHENELASK